MWCVYYVQSRAVWHWPELKPQTSTFLSLLSSQENEIKSNYQEYVNTIMGLWIDFLCMSFFFSLVFRYDTSPCSFFFKYFIHCQNYRTQLQELFLIIVLKKWFLNSKVIIAANLTVCLLITEHHRTPTSTYIYNYTSLLTFDKGCISFYINLQKCYEIVITRHKRDLK